MDKPVSYSTISSWICQLIIQVYKPKDWFLSFLLKHTLLDQLVVRGLFSVRHLFLQVDFQAKSDASLSHKVLQVAL